MENCEDNKHGLITTIIPASLGDETSVPIENGRYYNTIVKYEANGNHYLYDENGVPTILGRQGIQGIRGERGFKGDKGDQGIQGIQGVQGVKGERGLTGPAGPAGPAGPVGPVGPAGPIGTNLSVYSSTRTHIGTWVDNREVYRRVITGTGDVPTSIPFEKFTTIVKSEMMVKNQGAGQAWRMIPWLFNGNVLNWYGGYYFLEDNRTIAVQLGNEIKKAVYWHIIVEYCID